MPLADRTEPVTGQRIALGGTAANIARCAARGNVRVGLLSRVGTDFPKPLEQTLRREGIDLRGFQHVAKKASPTCWIIQPRSDSQRTLIDQGAMEDVANVPVPVSVVRSSDWIHLATGDPEYQLRVARLARSAGKRVAADPGQEVHYRWDGPSLRRLLEASEILFGNRSEILHVVRSVREGSPRDLLARVPLIVRTEGSSGVTAWTRSGVIHHKSARSRRSESLVGAGDAFRGGFYSAWFAGKPLAACLARGQSFARGWIDRGGGPWKRSRPSVEERES